MKQHVRYFKLYIIILTGKTNSVSILENQHYTPIGVNGWFVPDE